MILAFLMLTLALSNPAAGLGHGDPKGHDRAFDYVVIVIMENQGLGDVLGSALAPFMTQLARTYGVATNYTAVNHPSLPNYLALVSGQDFSSWSKSDCSPGPGCSAGSSLNLVDRLESRGLTWKAYMENYPSSCGLQCSPGACFTGDSGLYAARHNPFAYFDDIVNSTERCNRIVAANSTSSGVPDDALLSDLSSPSTASNLMWLTPNLCNDMHDCPVSTGDNYLSFLVPKILSSKIFTHHKAALFITFDEGNLAYPGDYVYTVWAGPVVKTGFESGLFHSHYSFLSTLESAWRLHPLTNNDASAQPMREFFVSAQHHADHEHHGHHGNHEDSETRDNSGTRHKSDD